MQTIELKTMVLGPKTGKSTFIKEITSIDNNSLNTNTTLGVEVTPFDIHTHNGKRRLIFWEVGSQYKGLKNEYCIGANLAIIFKKTNTNEHLEYEDWLPNNIPRIYVNDYNITQNDNIIQNIKNLITISLL
jgi:hypothetical protein